MLPLQGFYVMCPRKCSVETVIAVGRSQWFSVTNTGMPLNSKTEHDLFSDFRTHRGMPSSWDAFLVSLSHSYVCVHACVVYLCAHMEVRGQPQVSTLVFYLVLTQGLGLFSVCLTRLAGWQADRDFPRLCLHTGTERAHVALGGSRSSHTCIKRFTHWALCPAQTQVLVMILSPPTWTHPVGSSKAVPCSESTRVWNTHIPKPLFPIKGCKFRKLGS